MGIHTGSVTCVTDLSEEDITSLASSLEQILSGLQEARGASSLNIAMFSAGVGEDVHDYFSLHLRIITRPPLVQYYVGDRGFMEVLLGETVIHSLPEMLAENLKTGLSQRESVG
jgi:galactose-1-phosphate uridylyltransferase